MDKRKGIIIAALLFLVFGLSGYVFAGSDEESLEKIETKENSQTTKDETREEEKEESVPSTDNKNENKSSVAVQTSTNENFALTKLKDMVNTASSRAEINAARNYAFNNNLLSALEKNKSDENLAIKKIINDTTAPVLNGVPNGKYTNKVVSITIAEENLAKIYLNEEEVTVDKLQNLSEGSYNIKVIDKSFNETSASFIVDFTSPVVNILDKAVLDNDFMITASDENFSFITLESSEKSDIYLEKSISTKDLQDGSYTLVAYDYAKNASKVTFTIDTTAPVITGKGKVNNKTEDFVCGKTYQNLNLSIIDENLASYDILKNNEKYSSLDFSEDGNYSVGAIDILGHSTTCNFKIDTKLEKIENVIISNLTSPSSKTVGEDQTIRVEFTANETLQMAILNLGSISTVLKPLAKENTYQADIKITSDIAKNMQNKEVIDFSITASDMVGNMAEFKRVDLISEDENLYFDKEGATVKYVGFFNNSAYNSCGNTPCKGIKEAKVGDVLRLFVAFDESLGQNPHAKIGNSKELSLVYSSKFDKNSYVYLIDYRLKEEDISSQGNIDILVYDIFDKAGNKTEDITKVTHSIFSGVTYLRD